MACVSVTGALLDGPVRWPVSGNVFDPVFRPDQVARYADCYVCHRLFVNGPGIRVVALQLMQPCPTADVLEPRIGV